MSSHKMQHHIQGKDRLKVAYACNYDVLVPKLQSPLRLILQAEILEAQECYWEVMADKDLKWSIPVPCNSACLYPMDQGKKWIITYFAKKMHDKYFLSLQCVWNSNSFKCFSFS